MQDKGLVQPGYGFYPRVSYGPDYWQFYLSFGGTIQDPASGKLVFDKTAMEKVYQFFVDAVAKGVTKKESYRDTLGSVVYRSGVRKSGLVAWWDMALRPVYR